MINYFNKNQPHNIYWNYINLILSACSLKKFQIVLENKSGDNIPVRLKQFNTLHNHIAT